MKSLFPILLLLAFSLCSACVCKDDIDCKDVVKAFGNLIDENDRIRNELNDRNNCLPRETKIASDTIITLQALRDSQNFYSDSFSKLIALVIGIITILVAIIGIPSIWNWLEAKKYNKEAKEEIYKTKKETEEIRMLMTRDYLTRASHYLRNKHFQEYFFELRIFFNALTESNLKENSFISACLDIIDHFIQECKSIEKIQEISEYPLFLESLKNFISHYNNKTEYKEVIEEAEIILKKFTSMFGEG